MINFNKTFFKNYALFLCLLISAMLIYPQTSKAGGRYSDKVLAEVLLLVNEKVAKGEIPTVIFDLDDTLFEAGSRTLAILKELACEPQVKEKYPCLLKKLEALDCSHIKYELKDNLDMLEITDQKVISFAKKFWFNRFFSNLYCKYDLPNPGGVSYVNRLHLAGANIVYLSGRPVKEMGKGTLMSLKAHNFPTGERTELILKPCAEMNDFTFKQQALQRIKETRDVVAGFENEPCNVNLMQDIFMLDKIVFVDTLHSDRPDKPYECIPWVKNFELTQ